MTADELISTLNRIFGTERWPKTFEVDSDTYGHCCQRIFDSYTHSNVVTVRPGIGIYYGIWLGPNKGLMFKNIELILKG